MRLFKSKWLVLCINQRFVDKTGIFNEACKEHFQFSENDDLTNSGKIDFQNHIFRII